MLDTWAGPVRSLSPDAPVNLLPDPVEQWLQWEEQANLIGFRTSTEPVTIEVSCVDRARVRLAVPPGAPPGIVARFVRGDRVLFPKHPLNRDPSVAFFGEPVVERWQGRYTSSRTLVVPGAARTGLFSMKLATDHPHPDFPQPEKTRLGEEARDAIQWLAILTRTDALLDPEPGLEVVPEAFAVLVPDTDCGYLVRDLRPFQDGHYYLPALSIPWVGRQIARRHGRRFESFWGRHYAEAAGRAKASLLARTGLQFETPNPQNVLVQLDPDLTPTGRIVVRDLGDANCVTDARTAIDRPWSVLLADVRPETRNSFWAFGEAGAHSVDEATLESWYGAHDRAYFDTLASWFPELRPTGPFDADRRLAHWNAALRDSASAGAIARGFDRGATPKRSDARLAAAQA